jgi:hypothetical protein
MKRNRRQAQAAEMLPPEQAPQTPWPQIDKYPTVIGSNLTLTYLAAVFRLCQTGYRREYVDCLDELLERDPHAYCCYSTRILSVASARITCDPAPCKDGELELAKEIAAEFQSDFLAIANLRQSLAALLWACYYGVQASEIGWEYTDHYAPKELFWIHSRRIAYPDPNSWAPRIWDLGGVNGWGFLESETTQSGFGLKIEDWPNKFIVHAPQYRGDYPTRDGVGRETAIWSALKTMGARGAAQYIERFAKPWVLGYFKTTDGDNPRKASAEGIKAAENAIKGLGAGNLSGALLEDAIKLELAGPGANSSTAGKLVHDDFIRLCDAQTSKATLGNSDSVESGPNGARASTSERMKGQRAIYKYEAACLGDTLKRDLAMAWMRLNKPGLLRLCPSVTLHIEEELTPQETMELAKIAAGIGVPVDADKLSAATGVAVIPKDAKEGRVCLPVAPVSDLLALQFPYEPPKPETPSGTVAKPGVIEPTKTDGEKDQDE